MWKKDEAMSDTPPEVDAGQRRPPTPAPASSGRSGHAIIGPSITIHGEVTGDEDLLIQGQVDGSVDLDANAVTVGAEGRVKANITARVVTVEGQVEGDLKARDQVILRSQAQVKGDITAPRVVLEDGASFRGLVDMGDTEFRKASAVARPPASESSAGAARSSGTSPGSSEKAPKPTASTSQGSGGGAGKATGQATT